MNYAGVGCDFLQQSLTKEEFRYWIIPAGDQPFTFQSYYTQKPLFDPSVGQLFLAHYQKVDSSGFYDVYQAKGKR